VERTDVVGAGPGSVGWQAPEVMSMRFSPETPVSFYNGNNGIDGGSDGRQESMVEASPIIEGTALNNMRTSRSVDIFSLGCIFYCVCVPGSHPFGEWYEREANIMKNNPSIESLVKISVDASDLVKSMIDRDPKMRPTAAQVCDHPFFWSATKRLSFLCEFSDRLEADSSSSMSSPSATPTKAKIIRKDESATNTKNVDILFIERNAAQVVGTAWDKDLDPDLLSNVSRFRTYDPCSVRDCLRIIRNKYHHYDELDAEIKQRIGPNPDNLLRYFESKFPRLVMHCYNVCRDCIVSADDPFAAKYGIIPRRPMQLSKTTRVNDSSVAESATVSFPDKGKIKNGVTMPSSIQEVATLQINDETSPSAPINGEKDILSSSSNNKSCLLSSPPNELTTITTTSTNTLAQASETPSSSVEAAEEQIEMTPIAETVRQGPKETKLENSPTDLVMWEGSNAAKTFQCRGWMRSEDDWIRRTDVTLRKRDANITRCATDPKFRTRLCNHWDSSGGTFCPMRKKSKCIFAHGPVELRVKEGKRNRWGKLVDKSGNNSNPFHSGGEDTYGTARLIESQRKEEGKWNTKPSQGKGRSKGKQSSGRKR